MKNSLLPANRKSEVILCYDPLMGIIPRRSVHSRFLLTLVVFTGFGIGFLFTGGDALILSWIRSAEAVITCDNDGTVDAGETCSNCPFDVRCTAAQKCIAGACSSASWSCKREDVCGDGWVSDFEECDDGGICTGSTNASLNGRVCFDLDPARPAGVARCRATGGICVAQDGDGCTSDCQTECKEDGAPCLLASECCGSSCTDGVCGAGGGGAECGNEICESTESCGSCAVDCGSCVCSPVCPICDRTHKTWTMTMSGLNSEMCSGGNDCNSYNGTYPLVFDVNIGNFECASTACGWCWESNAYAVCGAAGSNWLLRHSTINSRFELYAGGELHYVLADASWDCDGPNIFTFLSATECTGWPASVTLTPSGSVQRTCALCNMNSSCDVGTEDCTCADCTGQQANCSAGKVCSSNGSCVTP